NFEENNVFPCDGCQKLFCAGSNCRDLTASEVKCVQLKQKRRLIFLWVEYKGGFWKVPTLIKEIDELKKKYGRMAQGMEEAKSS
ncbi:hypothetical protein HHI36_008052, partial [Cryptolaemus montrouzieri]